MNKIFDNMFLVCVMIGFSGCGGAGDPASGGVADAVVVNNDSSGTTDSVGPVADSSVPSDEDTGIASDTSVENDTTAGDTVDYPEPGSVEYWVGIIPGVWEEKPCVSDECMVTLVIDEVVGEGKIQFPDCLYSITEIPTIGYLCLEKDLSLSLCKNDASCSFQATGMLEEKVIAHGTCGGKSDNARQCVRSSDCVDLIGASQCVGMQVEYWMNFCTYGGTVQKNESCMLDDTEKNLRRFHKVQ